MPEEKKNGATPPPKISLNLRPPVATPGKPKSDTARVDLSSAQPTNLTPTGGEPLNIRDVLDTSGTAKSSTSRISLSDTQTVAPGETVPVAKISTGPVETAGARTETARVRLAAEPGPKKETVRVDLGGAAVTATAPISMVPEAGAEDASKNRTARIAIDMPAAGESIPTGEVPTGAPLTATPPPKTVRLTRPSAATPKTVVLKRPEPAAEAPKTVVLKRPDERIEEKGATARIAIPEAAIETAPPTQRKTIRIKRAGAPGAAPAEAPAASGAGGLRIARTAPSEEAGAAIAEIEEAVGVPAEKASLEPGTVFAILSIAATLVLGVLVYVLLQQTYFPDWSWPGKLVEWSITSQQATLGIR